jgi:pimeloyl-ACP methyl ester carboxylesterase
MRIEGAAAPSGNYLQANGIDIYYETYGSGEPLLLLLGGAGNLNMWDQHGPIFAQHVMVIATDSRAHGRTKNPLDTLSYRMLADDTAAFIRVLGLDRPWVCGYSDGGQIALEMAMN